MWEVIKKYNMVLPRGFSIPLEEIRHPQNYKQTVLELV